MAKSTHSELIQDQFTRQAGVFNAAATITNEQALKMIMEAGQAGSNDTVLDVACGGGIVVCAFASHVRHATGIDMTPAMPDQSRKLAAQKQLTNVTWMNGDVTTLPFPDASFSMCDHAFLFSSFPRSVYGHEGDGPGMCTRWSHRRCRHVLFGGCGQGGSMEFARETARSKSRALPGAQRAQSHVFAGRAWRAKSGLLRSSRHRKSPAWPVISQCRRRREDHADVFGFGQGRQPWARYQV